MQILNIPQKYTHLSILDRARVAEGITSAKIPKIQYHRLANQRKLSSDNGTKREKQLEGNVSFRALSSTVVRSVVQNGRVLALSALRLNEMDSLRRTRTHEGVHG